MHHKISLTINFANIQFIHINNNIERRQNSTAWVARVGLNVEGVGWGEFA